MQASQHHIITRLPGDLDSLEINATKTFVNQYDVAAM